ncbi:MAG: histidine kinase [Candidatus Cloacimonetes bacterium]|nr:histidine kinase [Candidatus Cloacimonadota bacterium]
MKLYLSNTERQMYNWWTKIRWFIVIVMFAIGILRVNQTTQTYPTILLAITFVGISILNILFHLQVLYPNQVIGAVQIVLDIVFATLVVHLTGGMESHFVWIYLIAIITASLSIEKAGGFLASMIGTMCMLILIILYNFGWLKPVSGITYTADISSQTIFLISYTTLFSGISFIASYISNLLKDLSENNDNLQTDIENLNAELEKTQHLVESNKSDISKFWDVVRVSAKLASIDHDINNPLTIISLSIRRVQKAADEYRDDKLKKSGHQMNEAINSINGILVRLQELKKLELIKEERKKLQE